MKILSAIDSFKGSFTSKEANKVVQQALPQHRVETFSIADGGEGTVEAFLEVLGGTLITETITGPTGSPIKASYGWIAEDKTAIIEVAEGAGLTKVDIDRNPRNYTSYGVGEQMLSALNLGAKELIIGLGGSATVDGGVGLLQSLGVKFFDAENNLLPMLPVDLEKIQKISTDKFDNRLSKIKITVACDVENPLLGPNGAVYIFGPQKGLRKQELQQQDQNMAHYQQLVNETTQTTCENFPGAGAAGGIGFALYAFLMTSFSSGFQLLADRGNLREKMKQADLVITGEGKFDSQSLQGKVPIGISRLAKEYQVPTIVFAGTVADKLVDLPEENILAVIPITESPISLEESIQKGPELLSRSVKRAFKLIELNSLQHIDLP
ncbi:glycerate kinase [Desemzia sp. FAM 23989]|uniref:glycerate kinase family protein n=1 Tax=Desemzia sp. FAM 23989 TaxID=3259523 RepID=UPI00388730C1